jgi:hypothetical protein
MRINTGDPSAEENVCMYLGGWKRDGKHIGGFTTFICQ